MGEEVGRVRWFCAFVKILSSMEKRKEIISSGHARSEIKIPSVRCLAFAN